MASVRIESGPPSATALFLSTPRAKWRDLLWIKRDFLKMNLVYDCRCLIGFVKETECTWKELGFESAEAMIRDGYELDPEEVSMAVEWLRIRGHKVAPIPITTAVTEGRKLAEHGGDRKSEKVRDQGCNTTLKRGTATHWLARLDRDNQPLAAKVRAGKLTVNAAAIEAGFRRRTIQIPLDVSKVATALLRHFTAEELRSNGVIVT